MGSRMGRPEKAKMRKLTGSPHGMFPVGAEGGRLRDFNAAIAKGKVTADFSLHKCDKCNKQTIYSKCHICDAGTRKIYSCKQCQDDSGKCGNGNLGFRKLGTRL